MPDANDLIAADVDLQGRACRKLGSPLYADLMAAAAAEAARGGIVAQILLPLAYEPAGSAITLRLFGAVHRLALTGAAPDLAAAYPSCGGDPTAMTANELWSAFENACRANESAITARLGQAPQTNEVGRGVALRGALDLAVGAARLPVRLVEIGASAGLNLLVDRFALRWPGGSRGPASSPVTLDDAWTGSIPDDVGLSIVERGGCDIHPLDATAPDDALTLQSFVWPDQRTRLDRLRGAIEIACTTTSSVKNQSADEFLAEIAPTSGIHTVVQHSVMWQYLPDDVRAAATGELERLTRTATPDAPVAHISLEPPRTADDADVDFRAARRHGGFIVSAGCAPYFDDHVVGYCPPHGPPAHWL
ncbi:DUF2332 domain-containing protein [Gordonia sp. TBRC 11910]|uniref:DUF2332 domain-containing protein n=1 Tax=Gordonia asplenii TaxID=2725283 RepID=A0A848L8B3_9ACTN|nr:DUF2332 domain-containing protein [Gordonia asplenii]NMO04993.1 DUF2332 domain-containing protein [Gordonia asplenii]